MTSWLRKGVQGHQRQLGKQSIQEHLLCCAYHEGVFTSPLPVYSAREINYHRASRLYCYIITSGRLVHDHGEVVSFPTAWSCPDEVWNSNPGPVTSNWQFNRLRHLNRALHLLKAVGGCAKEGYLYAWFAVVSFNTIYLSPPYGT